jgi:N-dimethylarginine dimethylaminohydrolase
VSETTFIEIEGHIFDSHLFEKVLDAIRARGASYRIVEVQLGSSVEDTSRARIVIEAPNGEVLLETLEAATGHGARILTPGEIDPSQREELQQTPDTPVTLSWGRRYVMCAPEYFGVSYEINPWMHTEVRVDRDRAWEQWHTLVRTLETAGARIEQLDPVEDLPDYVFTANAGVIDGKTFIPASFRHRQRQGETPHAIGWFRAHGYQIAPLPPGLVHEGAGDALPFNDVLISGYRIRSDAPSHAAVARITRAQVRAIELVDPRFYHLDITFCPLDARRALVVPQAWDAYGQEMMRALVPEPLVLDDDEALAFCANSVVIDRTVVMPACTPRIEQQLRAWGFDVVVVDVSEFLKAGGAVRCLTLALDVDLG